MATVTDSNTERIARLEGADEHLATKANLTQTESRLTQKMAQMESRLTQQIAQAESRMAQEIAQVKSSMAQLESRMTWRIIGAAGVIIAAVGLMVRFL